MNPIQDLTRMLTTPLKALFVVGLCAVVNSMTYAGTWWVKWVALGMGIATLVALARGARTLLVLALLWWVGRELYRRHGQAARDRFDAWVASRNPQWSATRQAMAGVVGQLRSGGPAMAGAEGSVRH